MPVYLLLVWYGTIFYSVADYFRLDLTIFCRGPEAVSYLFLGLFGLASYVRYLTAREFNRADEETLVTTGLYHLVRHPEYAAFLIQLLSLALAFRSGGGCLITLLAGVPLTVVALTAEEKETAERFGLAYPEYKNKTKRLIPYVW